MQTAHAKWYCCKCYGCVAQQPTAIMVDLFVHISPSLISLILINGHCIYGIPPPSKRPNAVYYKPLEMLACVVSIDCLLIPINFPQREYLRRVATSRNIKLNDSRLFDRLIA